MSKSETALNRLMHPQNVAPDRTDMVDNIVNSMFNYSPNRNIDNIIHQIDEFRENLAAENKVSYMR